jgi:hypothetical protein
MSTTKILVFLSGFVIGLSACNTVRVWNDRPASSALFPGGSVAFVLQDFSGEFSRAKEDEIVGCLSDPLLKAYPTVRIVQPQDFRRAALLTSDSAAVSWQELLRDPQFKERIAPLGVRYVISISGETDQKSGLMNGLFVFGFARMQTVRFKASIFDLKQDRLAGAQYASATGKFAMVLLPVPIPVPLGLFTESRACKELGETVAKFLAGESPK